jgi:hypothetical protein
VPCPVLVYDIHELELPSVYNYGLIFKENGNFFMVHTEKKKVLYETNEGFVDLKKVSYLLRNPKRVSRSETISKPFLGFVD